MELHQPGPRRVEVLSSGDRSKLKAGTHMVQPEVKGGPDIRGKELRVSTSMSCRPRAAWLSPCHGYELNVSSNEASVPRARNAN